MHTDEIDVFDTVGSENTPDRAPPPWAVLGACWLNAIACWLGFDIRPQRDPHRSD